MGQGDRRGWRAVKAERKGGDEAQRDLKNRDRNSPVIPFALILNPMPQYFLFYAFSVGARKLNKNVGKTIVPVDRTLFFDDRVARE